MTHMDDQIAKHIKAMIRRTMRSPSEDQEERSKSGTLNQVVHAFRRGPDYPYDLLRLARSPWPDEGQRPNGSHFSA
jgi:hypothetical protein